MITNGMPGMVTPVTSSPAATRCISYQIDGNSTIRCGSLASIGRPVAVRLPLITQLLLLPRLAIGCSHSRPTGHSTASLAAWPDAPAPSATARPRSAPANGVGARPRKRGGVSG